MDSTSCPLLLCHSSTVRMVDHRPQQGLQAEVLEQERVLAEVLDTAEQCTAAQAGAHTVVAETVGHTAEAVAEFGLTQCDGRGVLTPMQ